MNIRTIKWQQTLPLRHRVLWPDKSVDFCKVDGDPEALHFGAFVDNQLICVASIFINNNKARLRKFATDPRYQNKGIGSKMLQHVIDALKSASIDCLWCDARESVIGFYKRFGMQESSERFYKAGIAYFKMKVVF